MSQELYPATPILTQALNSVLVSLSSFAQSSRYEQDMMLVFGTNLTSSIAQFYLQLWTSPHFSLESIIEIR